MNQYIVAVMNYGQESNDIHFVNFVGPFDSIQGANIWIDEASDDAHYISKRFCVKPILPHGWDN